MGCYDNFKYFAQKKIKIIFVTTCAGRRFNIHQQRYFKHKEIYIRNGTSYETSKKTSLDRSPRSIDYWTEIWTPRTFIVSVECEPTQMQSEASLLTFVFGLLTWFKWVSCYLSLSICSGTITPLSASKKKYIQVVLFL